MLKETSHIKSMILKQSIVLSEEAWNDIETIWEPVSYKRKTIITETGEIEKNIYFVTEGVQRIYYSDGQDREATLVFTYPYSFAGVLDSFLLQSPSRYYFETLTNTTLLKTTHKKFQEVVQSHPGFDAFTKKAINYVVSGLLERLVELQCFSSKDKFKNLLSRSPHILQLVPQKYLANYLGIDPTNFSKLINNEKI